MDITTFLHFHKYYQFISFQISIDRVRNIKMEGENSCNIMTKQKSSKIKPQVTRAYITKKKIIFELDNDDAITSVSK